MLAHRAPEMLKRCTLHFFFYGTLIAGSGNAAARAAHARLSPIGRASVPGALWAISDAAGWYPALVAGPSGLVHGMLYAAMAGFGPDDLARLDEWEDFRAADPAGSLYLRDQIQVTDAGRKSIVALVYRFNQPLPDEAAAIVGGDFQAWLVATGHASYSG